MAPLLLGTPEFRLPFNLKFKLMRTLENENPPTQPCLLLLVRLHWFYFYIFTGWLFSEFRSYLLSQNIWHKILHGSTVKFIVRYFWEHKKSIKINNLPVIFIVCTRTYLHTFASLPESPRHKKIENYRSALNLNAKLFSDWLKKVVCTFRLHIIKKKRFTYGSLDLDLAFFFSKTTFWLEHFVSWCCIDDAKVFIFDDDCHIKIVYK